MLVTFWRTSCWRLALACSPRCQKCAAAGAWVERHYVVWLLADAVLDRSWTHPCTPAQTTPGKCRAG